MKEPEDSTKSLESIKDISPESKEKERYSLKELLDDLRLEQLETT